MMIMEGSTCLLPSFVSLQMLGSQDSIQCETGCSRMGSRASQQDMLKELLMQEAARVN